VKDENRSRLREATRTNTRRQGEGNEEIEKRCVERRGRLREEEVRLMKDDEGGRERIKKAKRVGENRREGWTEWRGLTRRKGKRAMGDEQATEKKG